GWDRETVLGKVRVEGRERLSEALLQNRGVILLGFHFGNWELMSLAHSAMGYSTHVIGRALDNPLLDRLVNRQRERFGSVIINSKDPSSLRQVLSALHRKQIVGFLIDQNVVGDRGVFVDFFGRLAYTHKVVALIAQKTGAPVVPMYMRHEPGGIHRLSYEAPVPLVDTGNRVRDIVVNTHRLTKAVEAVIRRYPEEWLWMHDRWKKQPRDARPAVFLDRDGTVTREAGYIRDPNHLELIPGSASAIRRLKEAGLKVIVITNQSGVARGYYPESQVRAVNDRMLSLLSAEKAGVDEVYYCPHHPTEGAGPFTVDCGCRKPEPGMVYEAASDGTIDLSRSFVVGDKLTDMELAHRIGATGILVKTGYGEEQLTQTAELEKNPASRPDAVERDLEAAAERILGRGAGRRTGR
ncbi:MAG TPA: HAD-IIIA family hydrolase, partial [Nitrospiria bacterium]